MDFQAQIEQALESVRGGLAVHRGNIELVSADVETGEVVVRFLGTCSGCPLAAQTLEGIVEEVLSDVPGFRSVVATTDEG